MTSKQASVIPVITHRVKLSLAEPQASMAFGVRGTTDPLGSILGFVGLGIVTTNHYLKVCAVDRADFPVG
jgi:hypothetical protein